jgi:hypothetical protein
MKKYAEDKMKENADPNRKEYGLLSNNCATFARDVARADKSVANPTIIDPSPNNVVDEFIEEGYPKVEYSPSAKASTSVIPPQPPSNTKPSNKPSTKPSNKPPSNTKPKPSNKPRLGPKPKIKHR